MSIVNGDFILECGHCRHQNTIPAADSDFDCVSISEEPMGPESQHQWEHTHECSKCGKEIEIDYQVWEYPQGAYNHSEVTVEPGKVIQEFGYDFSGGPDQDDQ